MMQLIYTVVLASCASAQLYVGSRYHQQNVDTSSQFMGRDFSQQPLLQDIKASFIGDPLSKYLDKIPFESGSFTKTAQNDTVCATNGEAQWTGSVDVSDTRRLFYWAFESRSNPSTDPIIIWMNGGPGSTSTTGLFEENGPCILPPNKTTTTSNEWSWNNNATVIYLEQPAGVGLSFRHPDSELYSRDQDGSEDFQQFLNILFDKVMPEKKHVPVIIAAESYGGHYAPTYIHHILQSRKYNGRTAFRGNITGVILVDALLDFGALAMGRYPLLCENEDAKGILNDTACAEMAANLPELERMVQLCELHGGETECMLLQEYAEKKINVYYQEKINSGERSNFNIHRPCVDKFLCPDITQGNTTEYLNQPHIKEALRLSPDFTFNELDWALNDAYTDSGSAFRQMAPFVSDILDAHKATTTDKTAQLGDIKLLVLNGNDDAAVNTQGTKWIYDKLLWSGMAAYRAAQWKPLEDVGVTGDWKATRDGRLAFVSVDGAGHMVPGDQKEGSYRILQKWVHGDYHF